ncbi:hypothetical protein [Streptomyces sp. NPDC020917]|uniref:maltokinase N-terminal cap-like domain-containing protein n=1 Tax=Streptomyces sp. NPDC020917 TaxID=3365102 RepID=UPI003791A36F
MAKVHPGATLTPHFRDFLPGWVARQEWYAGSGVPSLAPVGYFRFEDPAGEVGMETHLLSDGSALYQIPLTYRGAPLRDAVPGAADPLVATTEHSALGTRWIYDGLADPVWRDQLLDLVRTGGLSDPSSKRGVGPAEARGHQLVPGESALTAARIDLKRIVTAGTPAEDPSALGIVTGTWHPAGPTNPPAHGLLAVLHPSNP